MSLYNSLYNDKIVERRVARDILSMIDRVCHSEEYREYRVIYGSKGQKDLIIHMIKEKYGVIWGE